MTTITLDYDARNKNARNFINLILNLELAKIHAEKTGIEMALEDVALGNVKRVHTPKNWKK